MSVPPGHPLDDDEISLRPYLDALWRYRRVIALATVGAAVLFLVVATIVLLASSRERLGILPFRLAFSGADSGHYPNGTAFNAAEIIAAPVISDVFAANALDRYTTLQDFQQALSVVPNGPAVRRLDAQYLPLLSNTRVSVAEHVRLENEYLAKRDAVRDPQFDLRLHRRERLAEMPAPLMETVLLDVLETWATQADTQKGAARPDITAVSRDIFARAAEPTESYLVRIDVMRTGAQRLLTTLMALQEIPGARTIRTADNRSIADELVSVEEILRVDLDMVMGLARVAPVSRQERVILTAYLSRQLVSNRMALRAASARAQSLQTVLGEYMSQRESRFEVQPTSDPPGVQQSNPPGTAQVSESFIEKMMTAAAAAQDRELEYRRELTGRFIAASDQAAEAARQISFYQDLLDQLSRVPTTNRAVSLDIVSTQLNRALERLLATVDRVEALNQAVSAQVLNPSRQWYSVTVPFRLQTVSSVPMDTILVRFVLTILVTLIVTAAACIGHNARAAARRNTASQPSLHAPL